MPFFHRLSCAAPFSNSYRLKSTCNLTKITMISYAATDRNRTPILEVLKKYLPESGSLIEIASATGQHCTYFAKFLPKWTFLPTDLWMGNDGRSEYERYRMSIAEWAKHYGVSSQILSPLQLDACKFRDWALATGRNVSFGAVFVANLCHIAPFKATEGLIEGAGTALKRGGKLLIYGPFKIGGKATPESNEHFDASLRSRNPEWGLRNYEDLQVIAEKCKMKLIDRVRMPANNWTLVFEKEPLHR